MASFSFITLFTLISIFISFVHSDTETSLQTLLLSSDEQESAYQVLKSVNSHFDWRSLFPDDLCNSAPHGLVCDYFVDEKANGSYHITELSFGYVSEYSSNPPCSSNATFSPALTSFPYLKKLFFYKCFTDSEISLPGFFSNLSSSLEELVFVENPSLFGTLNGKISNLTSLRRLVLTGTNVSGEIPVEIGDLVELEQITITKNRFNGEVPVSIGRLKKLKVLDLSYNGFEGDLPDSIGEITELLKLDLGSNHFIGRIPKRLVGLQRLEFLDLSWNHFGNYGVPVFLAEMQSLKEVYLSGNQLGGQIPEIWEKMEGILGLGLSGLGLVGKIPSSMGVFLKNVYFLGLDNNTLEGNVPEFGLLESVHELNLENNKLSGRIRLPLSAKFGRKIKLKGNHDLCVDGGSGKHKGDFGYLKLCNKPDVPNAVLFSRSSSLSVYSHLLVFLRLLLACISCLIFF